MGPADLIWNNPEIMQSKTFRCRTSIPGCARCCNRFVSEIRQCEGIPQKRIKQSFILHFPVCGVMCSHGLLCGLRDHPISFLPLSTCGTIKSIIYVQPCNMREDLWKASEATGPTIHNICLTSVSGTGFSFALTVIVGRFSFICNPLRTGQMQFCPQVINSLSKTTLFVYFLYSCFLLPYLANETVATLYIIGSACL
jgi:hypothetical protein